MGTEETLRRIDFVLDRAGLARAAFVEFGQQGDLDSPQLCDLWLIWGLDLKELVEAKAT